MSTFSALELKQDGDVTLVKIKHSSKPTLKDFQTYLKKKTLPTVLVSYPYGPKRITMLGYVKGKETELSQHELPPPCEATEIYGSIMLVCHSSKAPWDTSVSLIEPFLPADYEVFYEKACSGDLEEDDEEKDEAVEDDDEAVEDDDAEAVDDDADIEAEDMIEEIEDDVEEEAPRVRVSRKVPKIDPAQLQFQFKSVLVRQDEINMDAILENPHRMKMFSTFQAILHEHCNESDIANLELGVYNACIDEAKKRLVPLTWDHTTFKWVYTMISKRTVSNLHPDSYVANKSLIERWKEGEFTLDTIGHWTSYELQPANWKELKDQQFRRDKRILEGNLAMATDRFRCSRCNKKLCSYYELQTRSADEPMTIFISCLNCGKNWKQ